MLLRRLALPLAVLLVLGGIAIGAVRSTSAQAEHVDIVGLREELATVELAEAQERAPYEVLKPHWLPEYLKLFRVTWLQEESGGPFSVDFYYGGKAGQYVHIWQTNIPPSDFESDRDPTVGDERTDVGGRSFAVNRVWYEGGVELSGRIEGEMKQADGGGESGIGEGEAVLLTVSIDGNIGREDVERMLGSLR